LFIFFWLRVLDKAEYSAFESTLLFYRIVSYRIPVARPHSITRYCAQHNESLLCCFIKTYTAWRLL